MKSIQSILSNDVLALGTYNIITHEYFDVQQSPDRMCVWMCVWMCILTNNAKSEHMF